MSDKCYAGPIGRWVFILIVILIWLIKTFLNIEPTFFLQQSVVVVHQWHQGWTTVIQGCPIGIPKNPEILSSNRKRSLGAREVPWVLKVQWGGSSWTE